MLEIIKLWLQYGIIGGFGALTVIGWIQKDWNYGLGLNLSLTFLYLFLYLRPIK